MNSNTLKSVGAVFTGAFVAILLSVGTDALMHMIHMFPRIGEPISDSRALAIATVYRGIYGIFGAYITAWMAPQRPMLHAMILGSLGLLASVAGVVATWDKGPEYGPHWYPISLVVLALPQSWLGAKIFEITRDRNAGPAH
jgi:hypothetical protein